MSVSFSATKRLGPFDYSATLSADHEIVVLFGHSGAGKSVTLQLIAGLMKPDSGSISIDDVTVFDSAKRINAAPQERGVGYVVQDLALFPHMTVAENVAFGIPSGRPKAERVAELLALLGLTGFEKRRPGTLSGGQQQRVALARALARDARVLLLDEPFSALDDSLRAGLRRELVRLRTELGLTILFVTHDLREAHYLADRLAVFDEGVLLQFGPRDEVFRRPLNRRVGELTGVTNIWRGNVIASEEERVRVAVEGFVFSCRAPAGEEKFALGAAVDLMVRAERVTLRRDHIESIRGRNLIIATITEEFAYGASHTLRFLPDGYGPEFEVDIASHPYEVLGIANRKTFTLEILPDDIHIAAAVPNH